MTESTFQRMLILVVSISTLLLPCLPSYANDSPFHFSSETILGLFSREDFSHTASGPEADTSRVVPIYEYLTFRYADEELPYAMHVHGWARLDAGDGDYYEDDPDGELLYGYLECRNLFDWLNIRLGRQHIFSGVTNESVDGLEISTGMGPYLDVSGFAGYPAAYEEENGRSGDGIIGGRIALHPSVANEIGFSFKRLMDDRQIQEDSAGVDLALHPFAFAVLTGMSTYNLETDAWREHMIALDLDFAPIYLKPFYQRFQYDDFFSEGESQPQPFRYLQDTGEELIVYGGDLVWQQSPRFDAGIKFKQNKYKLLDESSRYAAVVLNFSTAGATRYGIEGGIMNGDSAEHRYQLGRGYWFWDTPFDIMKNWFLSMDAMVIRYDEDIYHTDRSLFMSLGCGKTFMNNSFQLKISGDYRADPYFDEDSRLTVILTYEH